MLDRFPLEEVPDVGRATHRFHARLVLRAWHLPVQPRHRALPQGNHCRRWQANQVSDKLDR